jgi:DNA-binding response OmpR family regulator
VVEDEPAIGSMCQRVLAREGFEVDIAVNGTLAQQMIGKKPYHICLIDIRTPKMNGVELYQWLREKYPQMADHVIFTTGGVIDEKTIPFIEQSGRLFLPKPFIPNELTAIVKQAMTRSEK